MPQSGWTASRNPEPTVRNRFHLLGDALILAAGTLLGYLARFEGRSGLHLFLVVSPVLAAMLGVRLAILWKGGAYGGLWRHGGSTEFRRVGAAGVLAGAAQFVVGGYLAPTLGLLDARIPLSILALDWLITILGPVSARVTERLVYLSAHRATDDRGGRGSGKPVLIVGAGEVGRSVALELLRSKHGDLLPIGFLDDDPSKLGGRLAGLPVLGATADLVAIAARVGAVELVLAMAAAPGNAIARISHRARAAGLSVRTVPSVVELISGRVPVTSLRQLRIEDLLRRDPVVTDLSAVEALIRGKRVLVTGAGGSIGQELCRQLAAFRPETIGLLGHGENSIFEIDAELAGRHPAVGRRGIVADIRDRQRMTEVFRDLRPALVFHAAAHKHVHLMEENPAEAITNNVTGTLVVAELSVEFETERFVLISTDKAVRPVNVMGSSKRAAELVVRELALTSGAPLTAVRFGNVLGSRGSVVPTFLRQIAEGGPLTITHPDVRRYFMSIPESVQLVLQAATLARGGEIFALEMGEPVRIVDLAEHLIRLSGLEPGRDLRIRFTGLRPGEKMFEEVFFDGEDVTHTAHPKIRQARERGGTLPVLKRVSVLQTAVDRSESPETLRALLREFVTERVSATPSRPDRVAQVVSPLEHSLAAPARGRTSLGELPA